MVGQSSCSFQHWPRRSHSAAPTSAQKAVFRVFLFQSTAFFSIFYFVVLTAEDAAASPAYHYYFANNNNENNFHLTNDVNYRQNARNESSRQPANFHNGRSFLGNPASPFLRTTQDDASVYRDFTTCSNEVLRLSCPTADSTVFLLSLYPLPNNEEAARNPTACNTPDSSALTTNQPIDLSCQYFKNNVQSIRSRCKSSSSCSVRISDLFDYSPPSRRACTVLAKFQCHPSPRMKNLPQYLRFCTNDVMRLTCPKRQDWLVITTAVYDYRPPSGDKTCSNVKRNVYCYAPETQMIIRRHCERKRSCKLLVNETTFGSIYGRSPKSFVTQRRLASMKNAINRDPTATAKCPSADNFALYVYFMCVPKVILSHQPRSSLANGGRRRIVGSPSKADVDDNSSTRLPSRIEKASKERKAKINRNRGESGGGKNHPISTTRRYQSVDSSSISTSVSSANYYTVVSNSDKQRQPGVVTSLPSSTVASASSSPSQVIASSVIEKPTSVFRLFSDWLFAFDYIQRNPYPVIATALLGVCIGLLLGAAVLLVRLACRLRAARYHAPRRSVGLQCEMHAGRPAVLVRSTASQTQHSNSSSHNSTAGRSASSGNPLDENAQFPHQKQNHQATMQQMAAMCAQTTVAQAPSSAGTLKPSLYAPAPGEATRPLLLQHQSQPHQPNLATSMGSSSIGSQVGAGNLPSSAPNRNYTYTPRLSVRWFQ